MWGFITNNLKIPIAYKYFFLLNSHVGGFGLSAVAFLPVVSLDLLHILGPSPSDPSLTYVLSWQRAEKHKYTIKLKASWQICHICQSKLQGQVQYQ